MRLHQAREEVAARSYHEGQRVGRLPLLPIFPFDFIPESDIPGHHHRSVPARISNASNSLTAPTPNFL